MVVGEEVADVVLLSPDGSRQPFLNAAVDVCAERSLRCYFLIADDFPTQIFSELKNPHLRKCKLCIILRPAEREPFAGYIVTWFDEH